MTQSTKHLLQWIALLLVVAGVVLFVSYSLAQEPKTPPASKELAPLTAEEKEEVRTAEVDQLRANDKVKDAMKALDQANSELNAANKAVDAVLQKIYSERKIKPEDASICEGPAPSGVCAQVKTKGLVLVRNPKAEAAK